MGKILGPGKKKQVGFNPSMKTREILDKRPAEAQNQTDWIEYLIGYGWEVCKYGRQKVIESQKDINRTGESSGTSLPSETQYIAGLISRNSAVQYAITGVIGID